MTIASIYAQTNTQTDGDESTKKWYRFKFLMHRNTSITSDHQIHQIPYLRRLQTGVAELSEVKAGLTNANCTLYS
jgi:hypothetical protein